MELRQLRSFAMVASELNFTRAAGKLHLAQPALSRQIKQLESELGLSLFDRNKRAVRLTPAGASFLGEARALLEQADLALVHARAGTSQKLNIGYVWGLFHSSAPAALQRLRSANPALTLNLFDMPASEQARALAAGRLDIGFIGTSFEPDAVKLQKERVASCQFRVVLPQGHKLARKRSLRLAELADELFLLIAEDQFPGASRVMQHACEAAGFKPRVLQVADRGHTLLGLAAAGSGVALLPETLQALPHAGVVFCAVTPRIEVDLYVAWRKGLDPVLITQLLESIA